MERNKNGWDKTLLFLLQTGVFIQNPLSSSVCTHSWTSMTLKNVASRFDKSSLTETRAYKRNVQELIVQKEWKDQQKDLTL